MISNVGRRRPRISDDNGTRRTRTPLAFARIDPAPPVSVQIASLGADCQSRCRLHVSRCGFCSIWPLLAPREPIAPKNRLRIAAAPSRCAQGAAAPSRCAHGAVASSRSAQVAGAPSRCACGAGALRIAPAPFWPPLRRRVGGGVRPTPSPS